MTNSGKLEEISWTMKFKKIYCIIPRQGYYIIPCGNNCAVEVPGAVESHVLELVCYYYWFYLLFLVWDYYHLVIILMSVFFGRVNELVDWHVDLAIFVVLTNKGGRNSLIFYWKSSTGLSTNLVILSSLLLLLLIFCLFRIFFGVLFFVL